MKGQKISRKMERGLGLIAGIWQIFNGLITIFIYAPHHRRGGLRLIDESFTLIEAEAISQVFGNIYMFIVTFGMTYMIAGIWLIYLSRKMTDNQVAYIVPTMALLIGGVAYFTMDILSVIFCLSAGSLALAKNKAIKRLQRHDLSKSERRIMKS